MSLSEENLHNKLVTFESLKTVLEDPHSVQNTRFFEFSEATGESVVTIADAAEQPIERLEVYCYSDDPDYNGYEYPWIGGKSKNLFKSRPYHITTIGGVTFQKNNDGSFSCSGQAVNDIRFQLGFWNAPVAPRPQSYIFSGCPEGGSSSSYYIELAVYIRNNTVDQDDTGDGAVFNADENNVFQGLDAFICIKSGFDCTGLTFRPMIRAATMLDPDTGESVDTDPAYVPYENICQINSYDNVNVRCHGKNLWLASDIDHSGYLAITASYFPPDSINSSDWHYTFAEVKELEWYTITGIDNVFEYIHMPVYDHSYRLIGDLGVRANGTYQIPSDGAYVGLSYRTSEAYVNGQYRLQFELGTTPTECEQPFNSELSINSLADLNEGRRIASCNLFLEKDHGNLQINSEIYEIDGGWTDASFLVNNDNHSVFLFEPDFSIAHVECSNFYAVAPFAPAALEELLADIDQTSAQLLNFSDLILPVVNQAGNLCLVLYDPFFSSVEAFNNFLSNNPLEIQFNPSGDKVISIPSDQYTMPSTTSGLNSIHTNGSALSISYIKDKYLLRSEIAEIVESVESVHYHFGSDGEFEVGFNTVAEDECAVAQGDGSVAGGRCAHAEGLRTIARGVASHAEGEETRAVGWFSHASGLGTVAVADAQFVFGRYNQPETEGRYIEIVGNGTNNETRSNARILSTTGSESLAGSLTLGMGTADETTITAAQLKALLALLPVGK